MPTLPISAFVAVVLAYLALRTALSGGRPLLVGFLAACAAQSLLVTLVGGYGVGSLRPMLPVTATIIPPLAWITFRDALVRRPTLPEAGMHAAAPAFTLFARAFAPETTDVIVSLVFLGYGGAILLYLRGSADMPLARLDGGGVPVVIWQALGWALIASAIGDGLIALAFAAGHGAWTGWLITISSSLVLLLVGLLSVNPAASGPAAEEADGAVSPARPGVSVAEDVEILARLDAFLAREPVHLDPNLTLARLARRLHLPEKRLSSAVNRATGGNVSRHVNAWRIRHACTLIEAGSTATDAMLGSGFNTKSNFNREFRRVTGAAPSQWRLRDAASPTATTIPLADRIRPARRP